MSAWRWLQAVGHGAAAFGLLVLAGVPVRALATVPSDQPVFEALGDAAAIARACTRSLAGARSLERRLQTMPADGRLLTALDALTRHQEDLLGPLGLLSAVHPSEAVRDAAQACERRHQAFASAFLQNVRIHRALRAVEPADDIDARMRQQQLDAFVDAGVALPSAGRKRMREISRAMAKLTQDFERRILEDTRRVAFTEEELAGVPVSVWRGAPRDEAGRVQLGLDAPTYQAVIEHASDGAARERMWRAGLTQGGAANLRTLDRLARLRQEQARLLGFSSHADLVLRTRMAGSAARASAFIDTVQRAVAERERADLALLREAKAAHLGRPDVTVARWDVAYYTEQLRRARHAVDQEQFRRHLPGETGVGFVFRLAERLFGVRFVAAASPGWHPEARAYTAMDVATSSPLGTLYLDLYPREGKYNHAAVWGVRSGSRLAHRLPAAALVVNFNREGLNLDELETLLHEFGHALHVLLSDTRYAAHAGTNTELDFVEAPSQMLEDWVYDPRVMALVQEVCPACPSIPPERLAAAREARDFAKGLRLARQQLFAAYDLALHGARPREPMALWRDMEGGTPLGHVAGSQFPAGFGHIAGHYAGGYYSYLWSLVLAEDLRTAFADDRLSADTGRRYRADILAPGGQAAPDLLMQRFLGRPWSADAFFNTLAPRRQTNPSTSTTLEKP